MACDNISGPEKLASLRSKLVNLFWNKLPETLITWSFSGFLFLLFQVILFISKSWCNKTFLFSMLEIDEIMRLYFLLGQIICIWAMVDKLPKTLWFIFVNDWNTNSWWFFNFWSFLIIFEILIFLCWYYFFLLLFIQKCRIVCIWREINVTIWTFMVKLKAVIIINIISFMFVSSVWSYLE